MEDLRSVVNIPNSEGSSEILSGYWWNFGTLNSNTVPFYMYVNRWNVLVEIRNINSVSAANEVSRRMGLLLR